MRSAIRTALVLCLAAAPALALAQAYPSKPIKMICPIGAGSALLVMPKGTPMEVARRWNGELNELLADRAFVDKIMTAQAMTVGGGSPEDLQALLRRKMVLGAELAKMANLKYD